jgi:hypothetical protein
LINDAEASKLCCSLVPPPNGAVNTEEIKIIRWRTVMIAWSWRSSSDSGILVTFVILIIDEGVALGMGTSD